MNKIKINKLLKELKQTMSGPYELGQKQNFKCKFILDVEFDSGQNVSQNITDQNQAYDVVSDAIAAALHENDAIVNYNIENMES